MKPLRIYAIIAGLIILVFLLVHEAGATTVTGTVKFQGQPLTGYYDVALSYPGTTGTYIALPGANSAGHVALTNGQIGTLTLEGNDTLLPSGTYYQFTFYDAYARPLTSLKYVVTGSTFDIGSAVPTPITPANISYLDLLGLRNVSVQNLSVQNQIQIGGGAIYSALGVSNAKVVMDTRYATAYASTSTTCGVQEAEAALPATGGTVVLQLGSCTVTSPITITKPLRLVGHGRGGNPQAGAPTSPSTLANGMQSTPLIRIAPSPSTSNLAGVTLSDFAILGNAAVSGASSGDCIQVVGGGVSGGQVSDVTLDSLFVYGCKGSGVHASDGVHGLTVTRSYFSTSQGSGILLDSPASGLLTGTSVSQTTSSDNSGDGLTLTGTTVGPVAVDTSTFASNLTNGVNLVSGSVAAVLTLTASTLTDNHNAGLLVADAQGSVVADSQFTPGSHQLYGIYAPLPTLSDAFATQLTLRGNLLRGNLTADLYEGASTTYLLFYPQTERLGGTSVVYTLLAPNAIHYIQPQSSVATTCNANGCYQIDNDGTIRQWGRVTGGSGTVASASVTFPTSFTTTSDLRVTTTCVGVDNCSTSHSSPSVTGFTLTFAAFVKVGGSGVNLPGQPGDWIAVGH